MASKGNKLKSNNDDNQEQWTIEDKPVKVDKWDGAGVKNSLDDAAKKVLLEGFNYSESHYLMDVRLAICTIAVAFAGFALIWDYFNPFPSSRPVLVVCVLSYFAMTGILTLYTTFKECGCFLVALDKDKAGVDPDNTWTLTSQMKRYDDLYILEMIYEDGQTGKTRKSKMSKSVASFFDESGQLQFDVFEPEIRKMHAEIASKKDQ